MSREWENKQTNKKPILSTQVGGWYRRLEQQQPVWKDRDFALAGRREISHQTLNLSLRDEGRFQS